MNFCYNCKQYFIGDKRAGMCADCAYMVEKSPNK